jgi:hypothetical protein
MTLNQLMKKLNQFQKIKTLSQLIIKIILQSNISRSSLNQLELNVYHYDIRNFAHIIVFLQDDDSFLNQFENLNQIENLFISIFFKSRRKEINDLLKKRVFDLIIINVVFTNVRIFNFRFINEIKHTDIANVYEKSRLMIQVYNDHNKTLILTQSFIIQRISQRIIFILTACIFDCHLYLRNTTQTYVQSNIFLNRKFFI